MIFDNNTNNHQCHYYNYGNSCNHFKNMNQCNDNYNNDDQDINIPLSSSHTYTKRCPLI